MKNYKYTEMKTHILSKLRSAWQRRLQLGSTYAQAQIRITTYSEQTHTHTRNIAARRNTQLR